MTPMTRGQSCLFLDHLSLRSTQAWARLLLRPRDRLRQFAAKKGQSLGFSLLFPGRLGVGRTRHPSPSGRVWRFGGVFGFHPRVGIRSNAVQPFWRGVQSRQARYVHRLAICCQSTGRSIRSRQQLQLDSKYGRLLCAVPERRMDFAIRTKEALSSELRLRWPTLRHGGAPTEQRFWCRTVPLHDIADRSALRH